MVKFFYALDNDGRCKAHQLGTVEPSARMVMTDACLECGDDKRTGYPTGFCKRCRTRAVARLRHPAFAARFPTGYFEPMAMANLHVWAAKFEGMIGEPTATGCREWQGTRSSSGYGMINTCGRIFLAHRLAYLLGGGEHGHPVIMHTCDNPACMNPAHLVGGTYQDNMRDMDEKGRRVVGHARHLRDRPNHPKARAVRTPEGDFPSAALAAEALGVSRQAAAKKAREHRDGWGYI